MKAIYCHISDDLHKAWRLKLAQMGVAGKNVLISFVQSFVKEEQHGEKGKGKNKKDSKKTKT